MTFRKAVAANVTKAAPMGKTVQVKGVKTAGPALHLSGKSKAASVKSSPMSNKKAVVDMPTKKITGMVKGKNNYSVKSTAANVARQQVVT